MAFVTAEQQSLPPPSSSLSKPSSLQGQGQGREQHPLTRTAKKMDDEIAAAAGGFSTADTCVTMGRQDGTNLIMTKKKRKKSGEKRKKMMIR